MFTAIHIDAPEFDATTHYSHPAHETPPALLVHKACEGEQQITGSTEATNICKLADFSQAAKQAKQLQAEALSREQCELLSWHYHLMVIYLSNNYRIWKSEGASQRNYQSVLLPNAQPACLEK